MSNKLISIAMCTYNGEQYIREQMDSILHQTYTNFELIICDDCSTDKTVEIIKHYQKQDSRIKFHQNSNNMGFLKNFEQAISLCSGDYIALADQDDIWKIKKLEKFLKEIKDNVLIYSDAIVIDKNSNETGKHFIRPNTELCSGSCNKAFFFNNFVSGNTLMFKKELIPYILPIPQKMSYHDIWIGFVASTYGKICYTDEPMTYYRRYSEQITNIKEEEHKNIFEKLNNKKKLQIKVAKIRFDDLNAFLSLNILKDRETIEILNLLIDHYKNYKKSYFNLKLYQILKKNKQELFASFREDKRKRRAFRNAVGLKLRTLSLYRI